MEYPRAENPAGTNGSPARPIGTDDGARGFFRILLGLALITAGLGHLLWSRTEFQAQVPEWFPVDADLVVVLSGVLWERFRLS